jgi:hypothetical protein
MENLILISIGVLIGGLTMAASVAFFDLPDEQSLGILPKRIPTTEHHYFYIPVPCPKPPEERVS